ncbi:hypothetical protein [Plantibacter sp. YIM 135249]|uniref:hypothetical protein n=1 Tax=Plantibacter sp. YIM 135249 TaxID=3423918 RepID=UPI003D355670
MITVELPGLTLTNQAGQVAEYLQDLIGWFDGVDLDTKTVQRPRGDGFFGNARTYKSGRFVSVLGARANVGDDLAVFDLQERVMALQNLVGQFPVSVTSPKGTLTAQVELGGQPQFSLIQQDGVAEFTIPLLARDPRKYGPAEVAGPMGVPTAGVGILSPITSPVTTGAPGNSGQVVTTNTGRAETWSVIDITGGLSGGFELTCSTGAIVRFERVIPNGSTVHVDLKRMTAVLDGQNSVGSYLTRRESWSVPPGGSRTIQFNPLGVVTGTPTITAYTSPAYL